MIPATRPAVAALAAAVAATLAAPAAAAAHEVLHEVVRGRAVAVLARYAGGEPLAYQPFEVFSPADPKIAFQKGRTDRNGWLSFVPDGAGAWRVRIVDATGHGLDTTVEVDAAGASAPAAGQGAPSGLASVLRPIAGLAVVAAVFAVLVALRRRKGNDP